MTALRPFKAAVLVNAISALDPDFKDAFQRCINSACPSAQVDFFDPIEAQIYPEPAQYNLI
ncbi:Glucosinolate gamma-glutamyl hydrolase [Ascochyta lentis]